MRERVPFSIQNRPRPPSTANGAAAHFTVEEKRRIFKGMVVGELEDGFLRYSRRQALLRYAATLNIPEFEACLLIAEAQYHAGDIEPVSMSTAVAIDDLVRSQTNSIPVRLGFALVAGLFIDLMLIYWIL